MKRFRKLLQTILLLVPLLFGFFLRLRELLQNNDLWLDEAMIGYNLITRNFLSLFSPLSMGQSAPIGFLILEKIAISLAGTEPYIYHTIPFAFSILALTLLFLWMKKENIDFLPQLGILTIIALSPILLRYTVETKQYMGEFFFTLLTSITISNYFAKPTVRRLRYLLIACILLLIFSQSGIILVVALAPTLIYSSWTFDKFPPVKDILKALMLLVVTFMLTFGRAGIAGLSSNFLRNYWTTHHGFFALPRSTEAISNNISTLSNLFTLSGTLPIAIGAIIIIGILFSYKGKSSLFKGYFILAFVLYSILALLKLYPIAPRISLFWGGLFIPFVVLHTKAHQVRQQRVSLILTILLLTSCILLVENTYSKLTNNSYYSNSTVTGIREVYNSLGNENLVGVTFYIDGVGRNAHAYYMELTKLESPSTTVYSSNLNDASQILSQDINKLRGVNKLWIIFPYKQKLALPVVELLLKNHGAKLLRTISSESFVIYLLEIE